MTINLLDTTLRDGEQTRGVSFSSQEKLSIVKMLLKEVKISRVEVTSARVSEGELESVKAICEWAKKENLLEKIEVLGFVDGEKSIDWLVKAGCKKLNLLAKGSEKHCRKQLRKSPKQHFEDVKKLIENANSKGIGVNVYFEDWSNGMRNSKEYVFDFAKVLAKTNIEQLMLPDTLGILSPSEVKKYILEMKQFFPIEKMDFHAHNDYGVATANSLTAVETGVSCVHCTINGLGERTGNTPLAELVAVLNDLSEFKTSVDEKSLVKVSKFVEQISGKKNPSNKPIVGENVFTQTAGIHADGDAKGNLYSSALTPERFGRKREYALGKLSGKASLEHNLRKLKIDLTSEQKKLVLKEIILLGDKKKTITSEDLPFIISDILKTPLNEKVKILECEVSSSIKGKPKAFLKIKINDVELSEESEGNGGYDAFMSALKKITLKQKIKLPKLTDYLVTIPPGGKTDALVETTITWGNNGEEFRTIGIDPDQLIAAIKATEKMLNFITMK